VRERPPPYERIAPLRIRSPFTPLKSDLNMVKDGRRLQEFEAQFQRREELSVEERFRIFWMMLEHAKSLGVWPPEDPLEGIEKDLKLTEVLRKYGELTKKAGRGDG